jgi:hypothetical protein
VYRIELHAFFTATLDTGGESASFSGGFSPGKRDKSLAGLHRLTGAVTKEEILASDRN